MPSFIAIKEDAVGNIKGLVEYFKDFYNDMKDSPLNPYISHHFQFMMKSFSLFCDYYNSFVFAYPYAVEKLKNDEKTLDSTTDEDFPQE